MSSEWSRARGEGWYKGYWCCRQRGRVIQALPGDTSQRSVPPTQMQRPPRSTTGPTGTLCPRSSAQERQIKPGAYGRPLRQACEVGVSTCVGSCGWRYVTPPARSVRCRNMCRRASTSISVLNACFSLRALTELRQGGPRSRRRGGAGWAGERARRPTRRARLPAASAARAVCTEGLRGAI